MPSLVAPNKVPHQLRLPLTSEQLSDIFARCAVRFPLSEFPLKRRCCAHKLGGSRKSVQHCGELALVKWV